MHRTRVASVGVLLAVASASSAVAQSSRSLSREAYRDRLEGFWLGQCIANWTGRRTEAVRTQPPFLTDADWGPPFNGGAPLDWVTNQSPWLADDDTDIEYVYLHGANTRGRALLTGAEIRDEWLSHINRMIWVSNASARGLMGRGVTPPMTGVGEANANRLMIDAQLTTEFFGVFAPGMPERALALANLPVLATASGHAAHASQVYVLLHAIDQDAPVGLPGRERNLWLLAQARRFIPDTSKAADILDFCTADYLANPDANDWESTRDRVHARYQSQPAMHGFVYRGWYESSINFAAGIVALLYGEGDFRRTVQIGTLTGWDSDNATSTMGGLIGMRIGASGVRAAFPGRTLATTYRWSMTRDGLTDHVPGTGDVEDTFELMASRMLPLVEQTIIEAGGLVDSETGRWLLPPVIGGDAFEWSPTHREWMSSATVRVTAAGGTAVAASSVIGAPPPNAGVSAPAVFANALEHEFSGAEEADGLRRYFSTFGATPQSEITLSVSYDRAVTVDRLRFIEGDHFTLPTMTGGWADAPSMEARVDGIWTALSGHWSDPPDASTPFQRLDWVLDASAIITGVRLRARPGGLHRFVTCAEIDAIDDPAPLPAPSFDQDGNGHVDPGDIYAWHASPRDLDGDGTTTEADRVLIIKAVRWAERRSLHADR